MLGLAGQQVVAGLRLRVLWQGTPNIFELPPLDRLGVSGDLFTGSPAPALVLDAASRVVLMEVPERLTIAERAGKRVIWVIGLVLPSPCNTEAVGYIGNDGVALPHIDPLYSVVG